MKNPVAVLVYCTSLFLSACGSDNNSDATSTVSTTHTALSVTTDAPETAATYGVSREQEPEIVEKVDGKAFGLVGDGVTDNTAVFRQLLSVSGREITIPAGHYITGKLTIPDNTVLILESGAVIQDSGLLAANERLINIRASNITIRGYGAEVIAERSDYQTGEQRHGVFIFGAHNVLIEGLTSSNHGGDGFYVGGPIGNPSTDITLISCKTSNNRRQGLSITSARRVDVVDLVATATNGTAPQFGIDLEPNNSTDFMDEISIVRPKTGFNAGGGIMIALGRLTATSQPVRIDVTGHYSQAESPDLLLYPTNGVQGTVSYGKGEPYDFCAEDADCGSLLIAN